MPIASWGFAPALAAGNTVVLKPADLTPLTADPHRRAGTRGGHPRGRLPGPARPRLSGRLALCDPPRCRQGLFHRLDRGRPEDHGGLRRAGKACDPRARRQERQHRLRRRRHRSSGRGRPLRRVRQRRSGLLRPVAHSRPSECLRGLHGALRGRRQGCQGRRPLRRVERDGPADKRPATRNRCRLRARRGPGGFSGKRAGGAGLLVPADGAGTGATRLAGRARGDLRTGCGCAPLRGRGRCHRHRERHPLRALGLDLDPRRRASLPGGEGRRDGDDLGQLELVCALLDSFRRLQAVRYRA